MTNHTQMQFYSGFGIVQNTRLFRLVPLPLPLPLLLLLALIGLSGCSSNEGIPDDMTYAAVPPGPALLNEYTIQPRDQLDIKLFYTPELNETLLVRPDGKIALQLIGEVSAAGLTPAQLQKQLQVRYAQHLKDPEIAVILKGFSSQQAFVDGEVDKPGMVELQPGLSAWEAIIKAGGFKETATRESVMVIRQGEGNRPVPYLVDLKSDSLGQPESQFILQPHDIVFVPKTAIAEADKFVSQYVEKLLLFRGWYFNLSPMGPMIK